MSRPASKTIASAAKVPRRPVARQLDAPPPGILQGLFTRFQKMIRPDASQGIEGTAVAMTLRSPWRAVSIVPGKDCCQASQQSESRYLCEDAPRLPLAACTNPAGCQCKYRHFEDRRKGLRRSGDDASRPLAHHARSVERERRRSGGGRRITD